MAACGTATKEGGPKAARIAAKAQNFFSYLWCDQFQTLTSRDVSAVCLSLFFFFFFQGRIDSQSIFKGTGPTLANCDVNIAQRCCADEQRCF